MPEPTARDTTDHPEVAWHWQTERIADSVVVEQAKGIVMATTGCGPAAAFAALVAIAHKTDRKVNDLAAELVRNQGRTR